MNIFKIMFRKKLYFTTKSYCICILNYMYNFSNDWFTVGMIGIWFCNYLMILLRNCKLWTVLVTQFMYSLGLSLYSFSKLDYINTYFTSVIEMFELGSFLFWLLRCLILQFNIIKYCFSFHYSLISFHQQWYVRLHTGKRFVKRPFTWMYFRNIPKVFVVFPWKKKN